MPQSGENGEITRAEVQRPGGQGKIAEMPLKLGTAGASQRYLEMMGASFCEDVVEGAFVCCGGVCRGIGGPSKGEIDCETAGEGT